MQLSEPFWGRFNGPGDLWPLFRVGLLLSWTVPQTHSLFQNTSVFKWQQINDRSRGSIPAKSSILNAVRGLDHLEPSLSVLSGFKSDLIPKSEPGRSVGGSGSHGDSIFQFCSDSSLKPLLPFIFHSFLCLSSSNLKVELIFPTVFLFRSFGLCFWKVTGFR